MKSKRAFTTNWRVSSAKGVTQHELDRAKHQIEAHFILSRERTLDQAILLGQIETISASTTSILTSNTSMQ